jgi:hypothetical protein
VEWTTLGLAAAGGGSPDDLDGLLSMFDGDNCRNPTILFQPDAVKDTRKIHALRRRTVNYHHTGFATSSASDQNACLLPRVLNAIVQRTSGNTLW